MLDGIPRYIAAFHPKRTPHQFADVLVIGGGIAGLRAALAVPPHLSVLIISKTKLQISNSSWAQGGIAGAMDPEDRVEHHAADTMTAGGNLCHRDVVDLVVKEGPAAIRELMGWGARFDSVAGQLALGREGGHSHDRIVHAFGDATGREIVRALVEQTQARGNLEVWSDTFTLDLLTHDGACRGALVWNAPHGKTLVWAKQTILCTGGAGQVYRETTNPDVATGDGHAMAFRAGALMRDMEFMQFHPTVLYVAGSSRNLITEAMRGEGARLIDRDGVRFMSEYDPRLELAPRDVVSRAIVDRMLKTRHTNVFLDLRHLEPERVRSRFPGIAATCAEFGIDIARDRIPVRPGAHYMLGGLTTDLNAATSIPGLWAAGEVTSTGLHGANRLASNSLLEGLVFGKIAGENASNAANSIEDTFVALPLQNGPQSDSSEQLDLVDIRNSLKSAMGRWVGVQRDESGLAEAAEMIDSWNRYVLPRQFNDPIGWQLQNLLTVARMIVAAAQAREETRGVHFRTDRPETKDEVYRRHACFRRLDRTTELFWSPFVV